MPPATHTPARHARPPLRAVKIIKFPWFESSHPPLLSTLMNVSGTDQKPISYQLNTDIEYSILEIIFLIYVLTQSHRLVSVGQ